MFYEAEALAKKKQEEEKEHVTEMHMLRGMCGLGEKMVLGIGTMTHKRTYW